MNKRKRVMALLLAVLICFSMLQAHAETTESTVSGVETDKDKKEEETPSVTDSVEWRKEKAKELQLETWVDEEGWLLDEFYEGKSDKELEDMQVYGLVKSMTKEALDAYVKRLREGITMHTVTKYEKIQEGYDITGVFEVDGKLAFCVQHNSVTPPANSPTSAPMTCVNENLRKVLYYGYNGPANAGYSYVQTAMAASEANGVAAGNTGRRVLAEIVAKPSPPSTFKIWQVQTNGGTSQNLAFYTMEKNGKAKIRKLSNNTAFTDDNNCYFRQGAVYGVYTNAACTVHVKTLTTLASGDSEEVELEAGTYYVKEITAPKGYGLSSEVKKVEVVSGKTAIVEMYDAPQGALLDLLLQKIDAETGDSKPQGQAQLADAQFVVKFYKGNYEEGVNPETKGKQPNRQWILKTDALGAVHFSETYKVSGDAFWKTGDGKPIVPLGTITMQEIQAPQGYHRNPELFVRRITGSGSSAFVNTYQSVQVPEPILKVEVIKRQAGTELPIPDVEFVHVDQDKAEERIRTDANGRLILRGLRAGTHMLREVSAPDGYRINENSITFHIASDNTVTFDSEIEESKGKIQLELTKEGDVKAVVEDLVSPFSILIHKENNQKEKLEGAEFTLYTDKACTKEFKKGSTDKDGVLKLDGIQTETDYYLKETKAPAGYRLPLDWLGKPIVYQLRAESTPVKDEFQVYVNGEKSDFVTIAGTKAEREVQMTIENQIGYRLPETGSNLTLLFLAIGGIFCLCAMLYYRKRGGMRAK